MNIKPLRKPVETILSGDQYKRKIEARKKASDFLTNKELPDRFEGLRPEASLFEALSHSNALRSMRSIGDYYCTTTQTKLVSDEAGRVADILLTVPPYYDKNNPNVNVDPSDERHLKRLISLLWSADTNRQFTMLCQSYQIQDVENWFNDGGIPVTSFSISASVFNYSIWAQDAYVALNGQGDESVICEGVHFPRYDDATIADDVAAQTDKYAMQSYLYFQGGNVLEVGDYVLIGKDYIEENKGRAHLETEDKILDSFKSLFGKEVISLGRSTPIPDAHRQYLGGGHYQPIFHIDMYVTPTGKKSTSGKDIVAVGSPMLGRQAAGDVSQPADYDVYFDEAATQLSSYFEVVRIPLLPARIKYVTRNGTQERYYYLSFNNSVVENYQGVSNIFLPTFSEDVSDYLNDQGVLHYEGDAVKRRQLDAAAKLAWEQLGFTVYQMDGLEDLAIGWGSVHCITKTLMREI